MDQFETLSKKVHLVGESEKGGSNVKHWSEKRRGQCETLKKLSLALKNRTSQNIVDKKRNMGDKIILVQDMAH